MKKFNLLLVIMVLIISMLCTSFATETENDTMYLYTNESGELVTSTEDIYQNTEVVDDMEDYENLYEDTSEQDALKEAFEEQAKTAAIPTELPSGDNQKMVITEILSDIKSEYITDYYSYYIIKYQLVKIRDIEGTITPAVVILSYDIADNKNLKSLKAGDTVYGYMELVTSDSQDYNMVNHGLTDETIAMVSIANQDRSLGVVLLAILAILLLVLYAGKNGAKLLIPIFVAIDLLFIVFVPEIAIGKNILFLAILIALELIILITVLKHGLSRKTLVAMISSIIVVVLVTTLGYFFASTNTMTGRGLLSEEDYNAQTNGLYIDYTLKTTMDTQMLYIAMIIILAAVASATAASKLAELSEKYAGSNDMINNIIEEGKTIIAEYPVIISIIFFIMALPKYMITVYNGAAFNQIVNSEIFVTDLSLLLFTLIASTVISPIHAIISKLFMGDVEIKQIENK